MFNEKMRHIPWKSIDLRLVDVADAEFILSLRTSEKGRFLSATSADPQTQINWIQKYKQREINGNEFYYIIQSKTGEPYGTVRIYDIKNHSFCWGSWLIKQKSPIHIAIESVLAIYFAGFKILGYNHSHFDVRKDNRSVNRFHQTFGAIKTGEDDLNYYYELNLDAYTNACDRYKEFMPS